MLFPLNSQRDELRVASAHELFVCFLESIAFDRYALIDWLVSPETDCLAYLLAYTKRLAAAGTEENEETRPWRPPLRWLQQYGESIGQLAFELVKSLKTLQASESLPFPPDLLINNLNGVLKICSLNKIISK